MGSNLVMI